MLSTLLGIGAEWGTKKNNTMNFQRSNSYSLKNFTKLTHLNFKTAL